MVLIYPIIQMHGRPEWSPIFDWDAKLGWDPPLRWDSDAQRQFLRPPENKLFSVHEYIHDTK